jgi:NADH pyrophosphatase NudC (nudix superfamily)
MAEYIERDWLYEQMNATGAEFDLIDALEMIENFPAADVAPVRHSYWEHKITSNEENIGICHNCEYPVNWFWGQARYCPNCGARMDLEG